MKPQREAAAHACGKGGVCIYVSSPLPWYTDHLFKRVDHLDAVLGM